MLRTILLAGAIVAVSGAAAPSAQANIIPSRPVVVKQNLTVVTVEFISADPDHVANFYFRGSGDRTHVVIAAPDSDATGLGQFLFNNQTSTPGETVQLVGIFDAGDKLHFALDVLDAPNPAGELFKSNKKGFRKQFAYDKHTFLYHIEDSRLNGSGIAPGNSTNADYDDLVVRFTFTVIPSPGSMTLLGLGLMVAMTSRRRLRSLMTARA